jgi:hypothetical protein
MRGQTWRAAPMSPVPSFDKIASKYQLSPEAYPNSQKLRDWVRRYYKSKYVPEDLLKMWGFSTEDLD